MITCAVVVTAACDGPTAPADATRPSSVVVVPFAAWLQPGDTLRLTALALDAAGTPIPVSRRAVWRSTRPVAAAVDGAGLVTAAGTGDADVFAAIDGVEGSARIHVLPDPARLPSLGPLAAGDDFTCGVDPLGGVICWGINTHGQLGNGPDAGGPYPGAVAGLSGVVRIAAGTRHACAIDTGAGVWCWGWNSMRQAGPDGAGKVVPAPRPVGIVGRFLGLAAGSGHTCAVRNDGAAVCWGAGALGQLGAGLHAVSDAVEVTGVPPLTALAVGHAHTCGLDKGGSAWCWGWNEFGQLGAPTGQCDGVPCSPVPVAVPTAHRFVDLVAGAGFTCGLDPSGRAHCWGANAAGQLGRGRGAASLEPVAVAGLPPLTRLAAGREHACGLTGSDALYCWGGNGMGQLGDGTRVARPGPVRANLPSGRVLAIAAGGAHTCASLENGRVRCWGANDAGQLGLFPVAR